MGQNFASLAYGICTRLSLVLNEKSISRKNLVPRIEKFVSLVLPRKVMFPHFIIQFMLSYLSSGRSREVNEKENFKLLAVATETCSPTRGSKDIDFT